MYNVYVYKMRERLSNCKKRGAVLGESYSYKTRDTHLKLYWKLIYLDLIGNSWYLMYNTRLSNIM